MHFARVASPPQVTLASFSTTELLHNSPAPLRARGTRRPSPAPHVPSAPTFPPRKIWRQHQVCSECLRSKFPGSGSRWSRCSRGDGLNKAHTARPARSQATRLAAGTSPAAPATLPGTRHAGTTSRVLTDETKGLIPSYFPAITSSKIRTRLAVPACYLKCPFPYVFLHLSYEEMIKSQYRLGEELLTENDNKILQERKKFND